MGELIKSYGILERKSWNPGKLPVGGGRKLSLGGWQELEP